MSDCTGETVQVVLLQLTNQALNPGTKPQRAKLLRAATVPLEALCQLRFCSGGLITVVSSATVAISSVLAAERRRGRLRLHQI